MACGSTIWRKSGWWAVVVVLLAGVLPLCRREASNGAKAGTNEFNRNPSLVGGREGDEEGGSTPAAGRDVGKTEGEEERLETR